MKPGLIVICLFLFVACTTGTKADRSVPDRSYPRYNEVVERFFENYQFNSEDEDLKFIKDKTGWKVCKSKYIEGKEKISGTEPFWDCNSGNFLPLKSYAPTTEKYNISKIKASEDYCTKNSGEWFPFERCPYYGYQGWEKDAIADFGMTPYENLSDTILEGLARAYSCYADGYMWHQYGDPSDPFDPLRSKIKGNTIPEDERIDSFLRMQDKSIEIYKKLLEKNPGYETLVGNIQVKYFNELLFTYSSLQFCGKDKLAEKYLSQCHPDECYLNAAKNFLNSLEPNAILFSNGDNDTYPLWYLQNHMNYRKDVTVINHAMLGFPAYIEYLNNNKIVPIATPPSLYVNEDLFWAYYTPSDDGKKKDIPVMGLIFGALYAGLHSDIQYPCYTQKNTFIEKGNGKIPVQLPDYLSLSDRMALDIIQESIEKRPVYFTFKPQYIDYEHLLSEGITFRLTEKDVSTESTAPAYIERQAAFLSATFLNPFTGKNRADGSHNTYCFSILFRINEIVCSYYKKSNQMNKATETMKHFCNYFGQVPYPYYNNFPAVVSSLYEYKLPGEARKYSDETVSILHRYIFNPDFLHHEFITQISERINYLGQIEAVNDGDITQSGELLQEIQDFVLSQETEE